MEKCQECHNECLKEDLKCGRGYRYFGLEVDESKIHHRHKMDLAGKIKKCGHIIDKKQSRCQGQEKILEILYNERRMNQKDLQEVLDINSGSLSETVGKLKRKEFIKSEKDEEDARRTILSLTELGIQKVENRDQNTKDIFACLEAEEKEELERIITKLLKTWRKERDERLKRRSDRIREN